MSKSKGNVVNPIDIVEEYGSDALRMGIITGQSAGNNQPFGVPKVVGARNFCNKLWNIARYIEGRVGDNYVKTSPIPQTIADHWVLNVLQQSTTKIATALDEYRFAEAYDTLYHTIWDDVADWYIEASKSQADSDMLAYVLETILKLAHPFAPFVTEAIWQTLKWEDNLLITSLWPEIANCDRAKATEFEEIKQLISEIRQLSKALQLSKPTLIFGTSELIKNNDELIQKLARLEAVEASETPNGLRLVNTEAWLVVSEERITDYMDELEAKITEKQGSMVSLKKRLANKSYVANAPATVVQQTTDQLAVTEAELAVLIAQKQRFSA